MHRVQALRIITALLCGIALLLGNAPSSAQAEPAMLNPKLSYTAHVSDYPAFELSPDGSRVVYVAQMGTAKLLYSAPTNGSSLPVLLSPITDFANVVLEFNITPDGSRVVYRYGLPDQDDTNVEQRKLYSVPIEGGAAIQLNPMPLFGSVADFKLSPDGNWVVYRADLHTDGMYEIYSVPVVGGASLKINPDPQGWGSVRPDYVITPDNSGVIYSADLDNDDTIKLYSSPIAGFGATQLNAPLVNGGSVMSFAVSPDGSRVVYRADQEVHQQYELYSVATGPGPQTVVKLSGPMFANGDVGTFQITPDGSRVIYSADVTIVDQHDLYSVTITGNKRVRLNGPLDAGGKVLTSFVVTPDSSRVIYRAIQDNDDKIELYTVPTMGGKVITLNGPLDFDGDVLEFALSPDAGRVVYMAKGQRDPQKRLYSVQLPNGGLGAYTITPLSVGVDAPGDVTTFQISPDSSRVLFVYRAVLAGGDLRELYSVPISDGAVTKVNGLLVNGGAVSHQFAFSPDGNRVVYRATQEAVNQPALFASYTAAPGDLTLAP